VPIGWRIAFADVTLAAQPSNLAAIKIMVDIAV
jgi:hypothetical protein